jgi:hypothetical protein
MSRSSANQTMPQSRQAIDFARFTFATIIVAMVAGWAANAHAAVVFALTDNNRLLRFDSATPGVLTGVAPISGRVGNEDLIGIDFRPANNLLYGVGEFGTVYTINQTTAAATVVGTLAADPADPTAPYTQLFGSRFGFDWNPQADRLRITSDTRQNLRVNPTGNLVSTDTDLAYEPGPNQNETPLVVGVAYTNNFPGATSTVLFGIDSAATGHRLVTFVGSPNNGVLRAVGSLGINNSSLVGFDILTAGGDQAFAAFQDESQGVSSFYTVNLTTGAATPVGVIGGGDLIDGITVVIPEPAALALVALSGLALIRRR